MSAFGDQCPDYELVRIVHLESLEYAQGCVEQLYAVSSLTVLNTLPWKPQRLPKIFNIKLTRSIAR